MKRASTLLYGERPRLAQEIDNLFGFTAGEVNLDEKAAFAPSSIRRWSPTSVCRWPRRGRDSRPFDLIGSEPIGPCAQCGKRGDAEVLLIRGRYKSAPPHERCASEFFGCEAPELMRRPSRMHEEKVFLNA